MPAFTAYVYDQSKSVYARLLDFYICILIIHHRTKYISVIIAGVSFQAPCCASTAGWSHMSQAQVS